MSYRNLEVWQLAREVSIEVHKMSLNLPKFEQYEVASQIRRSSKSVRSNIVEGYGRRMYKADYIKFLICALASNDETMDHLETLWETKSLIQEDVYEKLRSKIDLLGRKLNRFISSVQSEHESAK